MKHEQKGSEVVALQEALITLGYPLPRWGVDGDFGEETVRAVNACLADHGSKEIALTTVTERSVAAILRWANAATQTELPPDFIDLRTQQHMSIHRGKRPWKQVTGITLHHTACVLGENPPRWAPLAAHAGITLSGKSIYLADPTVLIWHGNGFNDSDFGIELDGYYEGVGGDALTLWQDPTEPHRVGMTPTPELVLAAQTMVRYVVALVAAHGGKIQYIHAHRQSSKNRRADPGSALWRQVALPLMKELGLRDGGKGFALGGRPIPDSWDPRYKGIPY